MIIFFKSKDPYFLADAYMRKIMATEGSHHCLQYLTMKENILSSWMRVPNISQTLNHLVSQKYEVPSSLSFVSSPEPKAHR